MFGAFKTNIRSNLEKLTKMRLVLRKKKRQNGKQKQGIIGTEDIGLLVFGSNPKSVKGLNDSFALSFSPDR